MQHVRDAQFPTLSARGHGAIQSLFLKSVGLDTKAATAAGNSVHYCSGRLESVILQKQRLNAPTKPFANIRPRGISVTEHIREALLDRQLEPGSRVKEDHLSQILGVSRTPIRAALQTLAGEGLLGYAPHRGYTVRSFALSEIVDAYEMRALAEGLAARLSAERGLSDVDRARMMEVLARGDQILETSSKLEQKRAAYAEVNDVFHATIQEAAGSRIVTDVIRRCHRVPQTAAHNVMAFDLEDVSQRHQDHHRIYEAIICREPKEAESLMRAHISRVKTSMIRAFAKLDKNSPSSAQVQSLKDPIESERANT